ncbi:hypothetical protein [Halocatena pleomorpha]|uniref:Uncharacterized protein n=1 Tax=Halocatena pleomorpha TaxID=1785090 RepID=A0A3P3RJ92_9EURY|nr:hypothetical protein [Halocatena pleomorpha]RRJ33596.1 hypothetical protein EIK79_02015 [Halocatena pleomorpha]
MNQDSGVLFSGENIHESNRLHAPINTASISAGTTVYRSVFTFGEINPVWLGTRGATCSKLPRAALDRDGEAAVRSVMSA